MRVIQAHTCTRMPWKDGGGETAEVAIAPAGAGLEAFDWRVSFARVDADGPFSVYPGIDRTIALLDGNGIRLTVGDRLSADLLAKSRPLLFPGEAATSATLIGGPVTDFNVMTRRGRFSHRVKRVRVDDDVKLDVRAPIALLFCCSGALRVRRGMETVRLSKHDSLLIEEPAGPLQLTREAPAVVLMVELTGTG